MLRKPKKPQPPCTRKLSPPIQPRNMRKFTRDLRPVPPPPGARRRKSLTARHLLSTLRITYGAPSKHTTRTRTRPARHHRRQKRNRRAHAFPLSRALGSNVRCVEVETASVAEARDAAGVQTNTGLSRIRSKVIGTNSTGARC